MNENIKLVVFNLDNGRFGLPLSSVERVLRVAEITALPKAPEIVIGALNIQGMIIPVLNIRKRFNLPGHETGINDQIMIAATSKRTVGIIVDKVHGLIECPEERLTSAQKILPGLEHVEGVAKLEDGMVLIHNIDRFLSLEEENELDNAMKDI